MQQCRACPSTPIDQCLAAVKADVAADGVAAPATDVAALQKVVASAKEHGIDLKVVVMDKSPAIDTPLRDIATEIGQDSPGSTVLVLSPGWAGTYSTTYDRVILEAGQDVAKTAPIRLSVRRHLSTNCKPRLSLDGINDHACDRGGCSGCFDPSSAASGPPFAT